MTQYFFDISGVLNYLSYGSRFTGIQRVVVTLADAACQKIPAGQAFISYLDPSRGRYVAVPYTRLAGGRLTDPDRLRASFGMRPPLSDRQKPSLRKYDGKSMRALYHAVRFDLYAKLGRGKYQRDKQTSSRSLSSSALFNGGCPDVRPFEELATARDHLVLMDSVWGNEKALAAFQAAKDSGIVVHTMLHDLIRSWLQRSSRMT
ncbi:hypothetical protein [Jannaschia sp. CCS1]|uniref:hypothetical protein n=1 Tax=Jannaschia sp. (strain CCS1) TaxID=290400 RepID=UPI000053B6D5|nr:hypothetical protein [Jannaschia sp. CCS1]ABD54945.1 hypothetical protein Jann_2028 [Jannaschia sp. CCS1]